jgi:signal peptidase I
VAAADNPGPTVGSEAGLEADDVSTAPAPKRSHWGREWLILVVLTVVGTLVIRTFVVQSFRIPSESMEKTLHGCSPNCNNDRILVNKLSYKLHGVHRRDIVVFKATGKWVEVVGGPDDVVKRVIGLPGDTVQCCDPQGRVIVDGVPQNEPYVFEDNHDPFGPVVVPKGQLFVMGDHRSASSDSRYNGTIPESSVIGHAFVRIWPLSHLGTLH